MVTLTIKNSDKVILLDDRVHQSLSENPELKQIQFLDNLREHSSGCAVFQKTLTIEKNKYETKTIYLHKLVAEKFIGEACDGKRILVGCRNGNKLDCRLENLMFLTRSEASRLRKSTNRLGYTGVYKESTRYRAIISVEGKSYHLGMFDTAEDAAHAYNIRSYQAFGDRGKINRIPGREDFDYSSVIDDSSKDKS